MASVDVGKVGDLQLVSKQAERTRILVEMAVAQLSLAISEPCLLLLEEKSGRRNAVNPPYLVQGELGELQMRVEQMLQIGEEQFFPLELCSRNLIGASVERRGNSALVPAA